MRLFFYLFVLALFQSFPARAEVPADCEQRLQAAEKEPSINESLYDSCGFNDSAAVWSRWAPLAARLNAKKMLFEICRRFPEHAYHDLYCEKAYQANYGPALAYKAQNLLLKDDLPAALTAAEAAIQTKELSPEREGELFEMFGVYYLKKNDPLFQSYLKAAAERRSALANHILGIIAYKNAADPDKGAQTAFNYILRAVLLSCPAAEESLGLFHLARQNKIDFQTAKDKMAEKISGCEPAPAEEEKNESFDSNLLNCRCKSVEEANVKTREKPFFLKSSDGKQAMLEDWSGTVYPVSQGDKLKGCTVSEVHKTAVVILYKGERLILPVYKEDKCLDFCRKHKITENLSAEEIKQKIISGSVRIQPYRLTFTPAECETISYYAPALVDVSLPYVGKTECQNKVVPKTNLLDLVNERQREESAPPREEVSADLLKERMRQFDSRFLEKK